MSECFFCKGKTKLKNIDVDFRWGDKLFVIQSVPVEVCDQCGEKYYSATVSKRLDEIVSRQNKSDSKPVKTIEVPVLNWQ